MTANLFDLSGRVAVVIGGTSGIGRAIALGLADAGADVVASARRAEQVERWPARSKPGVVDPAPDHGRR